MKRSSTFRTFHHNFMAFLCLLSFPMVSLGADQKSLKRQLLESQDKIIKHQQSLKLLENNLQGIIKNNKEYKQLNSSLEEKLKKLKINRDELQKQLGNQNKSHKELTLTKIELEKKYNKLFKENKSLKEKVLALKEAQSISQSKNKQQSTAQAEIYYQLETLQDDYQSERVISETLKTQNQDLLVEIKKLRNKQNKHDKALKKLRVKIDKSETKRKSLKAKLSKVLNEKEKLNKKLADLSFQRDDLLFIQKNLEKKIAKLSNSSKLLNKKIESLSKSNVSKSSNIDELKDEIEKSLNEQKRIQKLNGLMTGEFNKLKSRIAGMKAKVKILKHYLKASTKSQELAKLENLKKNLRLPASLSLPNQRKEITHSLRNLLKQNQIEVEIDKEFGHVTLRMKENTSFFQRGSHKLNKKAQRILKTLIPAYTNAIFSNPNFRSEVKQIQIIGHASPTHAQKFVDPNLMGNAAYKFNQKLSSNRAFEIASFISSNKIGKYPYKSLLINKLKPIGMGYSKPIKKKHLTKDDLKNCGIYDCKKSRRVELRFILRTEAPHHLSSN